MTFSFSKSDENNQLMVVLKNIQIICIKKTVNVITSIVSLVKVMFNFMNTDS